MELPQRLAVIDMGSNSFRLVIFTAKGYAWERTKELTEPVRIGEGLSSTGRLGRRPMERALHALAEFAEVCRAFDLEEDEIDVVATSAIRDAENSADFLDWARERSGLAIRVLSQEAEAWYGYMAAVNSTTLVNGCVIDLGGGSMQLVRVVDRLPRETGSWRLGTVRMTERFLPDAPTAPARIQDLREYVDIELEQAHWLSEAGWRVVGLGDGPQPRGRDQPGVGRVAQDRPGQRRRASRPGGADRADGPDDRVGTRRGPRDQALQGRPDPGRRRGHRAGPRAGRFRGPRSDRGWPARGGLLRALHSGRPQGPHPLLARASSQLPAPNGRSAGARQGASSVEASGGGELAFVAAAIEHDKRALVGPRSLPGARGDQPAGAQDGGRSGVAAAAGVVPADEDVAGFAARH